MINKLTAAEARALYPTFEERNSNFINLVMEKIRARALGGSHILPLKLVSPSGDIGPDIKKIEGEFTRYMTWLGYDIRIVHEHVMIISW